jgi:hypothetical protein
MERKIQGELNTDMDPKEFRKRIDKIYDSELGNHLQVDNLLSNRLLGNYKTLSEPYTPEARDHGKQNFTTFAGEFISGQHDQFIFNQGHKLNHSLREAIMDVTSLLKLAVTVGYKLKQFDQMVTESLPLSAEKSNTTRVMKEFRTDLESVIREKRTEIENILVQFFHLYGHLATVFRGSYLEFSVTLSHYMQQYSKVGSNVCKAPRKRLRYVLKPEYDSLLTRVMLHLANILLLTENHQLYGFTRRIDNEQRCIKDYGMYSSLSMTPSHSHYASNSAYLPP